MVMIRYHQLLCPQTAVACVYLPPVYKGLKDDKSWPKSPLCNMKVCMNIDMLFIFYLFVVLEVLPKWTLVIVIFCFVNLHFLCKVGLIPNSKPSLQWEWHCQVFALKRNNPYDDDSVEWWTYYFLLWCSDNYYYFFFFLFSWWLVCEIHISIIMCGILQGRAWTTIWGMHC